MLLAADIGTTFLKAALADHTGRVVTQPVRIRLENPESPACWLSAFAAACLELDPQKKAIDCVMITGQGPTAVPVTADGSAPVAVLWDSVGGNSGTPDFIERVKTLRERHGNIFARTRLVLGTAEYLSWALTGCACASRPAVGFEHFYWDSAKLEQNNLDAALFPPFMDMGAQLGTVKAKDFPLRTGTPVLVPCPDYIPAIIGSGAVKPTMLCIRTGTGDGINLCTARRVEREGFMTSAHPNGRDWNLSRIIPQTGIAIENAIRKANLETDWENALHSPKVMPVLERICLETVHAVDAIRDLGISQVMMAQGSMDSDLLNRMRSASLGLPVSVTEYPETGLQGLAILAAASLGNMDIADTAQAVVRIRKTYNEKL